MITRILTIFFFLSIFAGNVWAEEPSPDSTATESSIPEATAPEPTQEVSIPEPPEAKPAPDEVKVPVLQEHEEPEVRPIGVSGRVDAGFNIGNPVQQGFSLPSLRLSAFGDATSYFGYRISVGQTKEYSSVLIPQLIATEAFVEVKTTGEENDHYIGWKIGMFSPSLNPWWSPDLSETRLPDYNSVHRATLPSRELGTQITYHPVKDVLECAVGAFNGNGIIGPNSNNAKAFNAYVKGKLIFEQTTVTLGTGGYVLTQSNAASANYKMNWIANGFMAVEVDPKRFLLLLDILAGVFEDSTRRVSPVGGAVTAVFGLTESVKLFGRSEYLRSQPSGTGYLKTYEVGPMLEIGETFKAYAVYKQLESGDGTLEKAGFLRVRLSL